MKVLFICSGNQCRSPFAKAVLKKFIEQDGKAEIVVESAGTIAMGGEPASADACQMAEMMGIDMNNHFARSLTADMLLEYDRILIMEEHHRQTVLRFFPDCKDRVALLGTFAPSHTLGDEIPDPTGQGPLAYRTCFSRIVEAVHVFYNALLKETGDENS